MYYASILSMNNTEQAKAITPPYLSVAKLERTIELVTTRSFNEVSSGLFKNYGFGTAEALLAVNTLKFLGVVDENGTPTELMTKIRLRCEAGKAEFEKIVRTAYKKLFDAVEAPQDLPVDDLANEFHAHYNLSPRIVRTALPVFLKLCEYAGLKEPGTVTSRKQSAQSGSRAKAPASKKERSSHESSSGQTIHKNLAPVPVAEGRLVLYMPSSLKDKLLDDEALSEDWVGLRTALKQFAEAHIPKEDKPKPDSESGGSE